MQKCNKYQYINKYILLVKILHSQSAKLQWVRSRKHSHQARSAQTSCVHILTKCKAGPSICAGVRLWFRESCGCLGISGGVGCEKFLVRPDWKVGVDAMAARMNIMHFSATMVLVAVATAGSTLCRAGWLDTPALDGQPGRKTPQRHQPGLSTPIFKFFTRAPWPGLFVCTAKFALPVTRTPSKTAKMRRRRTNPRFGALLDLKYRIWFALFQMQISELQMKILINKTPIFIHTKRICYKMEWNKLRKYIQFWHYKHGEHFYAHSNLQ